MDTVVLYPSPGMGHLVSMVELGKLLLLHHPNVSVTILTTPFPFSASATSMFIAGVTSAIPSIIFHSLPPVSLSQELSSYFNMEQITFDILRLNDFNVRDALASLSSYISSFMVDMFCSSAVPLAAQFCFPTYVFFTWSASCLLMSLSLPLIDRNTKESFKDLLGVSMMLIFRGCLRYRLPQCWSHCRIGTLNPISLFRRVQRFGRQLMESSSTPSMRSSIKLLKFFFLAHLPWLVYWYSVLSTHGDCGVLSISWDGSPCIHGRAREASPPPPPFPVRHNPHDSFSPSAPLPYPRLSPGSHRPSLP
ncbi:Phloretin 2'-O-glucosyltransferase-like protein [Drosera capensis]